MSDTQIISKEGEVAANVSTIAGVSVRAWIAIGLCATVCVTHLSITIATVIDAVRRGEFDKVGTLTTIGEPLYSMAVGALGFYFGQKTTKTA